MENLEKEVPIAAQTITGNAQEEVAECSGTSETTPTQETLAVTTLEQVHQDLIMTNTLLAVLIGGFAVYCFFRFLFKG